MGRPLALILVGAVGALASPAVEPVADAAADGRGVGFELRRASVTPGKALFDGRRKVRLRYGFGAVGPIGLRIEVRRVASGNVVRVYRTRAAPGRRLSRTWNGVNRRGDAVGDGRYEFRVGPAGGPIRFAGRFRLRTHVFPVAGPHGTRGGVGEFGAPRNGGRSHEGFDVTAGCGTRLVAARGGRIQRVGFDPALYGYFVLIDGRKTAEDYFYSHLIAPPPVRRRQRVRTGQPVGKVGRTGNAASTPCHLHFEIRVGDRPVDPLPDLRRWDRWS